MLQPVWRIVVTLSKFIGIMMWATPSVRSLKLPSLRLSKSLVRLTVLQERRRLYSDSYGTLTHHWLTVSKSSQPVRKCAHISMTSSTESSRVDSNNSTTVGDTDAASDAPSMTLRGTSMFETVNDAAPRNDLVKSNVLTDLVESNALIDQQVERTLFHDILPQILSNSGANMKNAAQESSKSPSGRVVNDVTILLGVSGGCDSVALLRILHKVICDSSSAAETNVSFLWNMMVVHFDHQQRQKESDQDRLFVQSLCQQLNVPCFVYKWNERSQQPDGTAISQPEDASFSQATARQWRRSTMQQLLSEQLQARRITYSTEGVACPTNVFGMIMTAHHKDDSDETVLLKLLRGVHIANIAGLSTVQPCHERNDDCDDVQDVVTTGGQSPSTSTGASSWMYWVRPLIHVRKVDIVQFLRSNDYAWREDGTNQSNKYLRNRVRNELIPLLQDMMGGSYEALERRIGNLEHQSLELRQYLNTRVKEHIKKHVSNGMYLLKEGMVSEDVDLVMKEALYSWTLAQTLGYYVSYEQMQRVYQQLINYPNHKKWQLNIGQHWNIVRYGDALRLARVDDSLWNDSTCGYDPNSIVYRGKVCISQTHSPSTSDKRSGAWLRIQIPKSMLESSYYFVQSTVGDWLEDKLQFTPPWQSRNRPIRVKEFLRGQRIPMHVRDTTPIVVMIRHSNTATDVKLVSSQSPIPPTLIAVYISIRSQWLVDREFHVSGDERNNNTAYQLYISTYPMS
jgi:tRNA(Ile)-lysidine synthetase-like protein